MMSNDPNPFERETAVLQSPQTRELVLLLYEAAEYLSQSNWPESIAKIKAYRTLSSSNPPGLDPTLEQQMQLMEAFCLYHMDKHEQAENILMDLLADLDPSERESSESQSEEGGSRMTLVVKNRSLAVRAHTLAATIIVSSNDTELDYKEIKNRLVNLLKSDSMRGYIPEVLGTLTGCKDLKALAALQDLPGMPSVQLARKMQIVADWKFMVGLPDEAIEFKRRAQNMWELLNCKNEFQTCQQQLKDLLNKSKSEYLLKLCRIKVFAEALLKFDQPPAPSNKQTLIKWTIPTLIDEILPPPTEPKPKKLAASESKSQKEDDKKEFLKDVVCMCNRFHSIYRQEVGSEATNIIQNSKFLQEMVMKVRRQLSILVRLRSMRLREGWRRLRLTAYPTAPVLSSSALKGKASYL